MKKTKDLENTEKVKKTEKIELLKIISHEDAEEFKKVASGRKFCKKGERIADICAEEIERYEYENTMGFFARIFKHHKFKQNRERLMLENRISSNIRAITVDCINKKVENLEDINEEELVIEVKNIILEKVNKFEDKK